MIVNGVKGTACFSGKSIFPSSIHITRGLSRAQKILQQFFPERQLIVRSGERMRTLRLSTNRQAALAGIVLVIGSWTLLSSSLVMSHSERIRAKNVEIKDARVGYEQLLAQVTIYKERVADLTKDLESNYNQSLALVDKESDILSAKAQAADGGAAPKGLVAKLKSRAQQAFKDPAGALNGDYDNVELVLSKAKLDRTHEDQRRKDLLNELAELQDSMVDVVNHHERTPFIAPDGLELRQVVLERDLADERPHIIDPESTCIGRSDLLIWRATSCCWNTGSPKSPTTRSMASNPSLSSITGLDVDLLLRQQKSSRGAGGPFIPVTATPENAGPLQESLDNLDARMDRLTDLQGLVTRPCPWIPLCITSRSTPVSGSV